MRTDSQANSPVVPSVSQTAYNEQQFEDNYPEGSHNHYWPLARNRVILRQLRRLVAGDDKAVILDVGCGRGYTVNNLRRHGLNAYGCDVGTPEPMNSGVAPFLSLKTEAARLDEPFRLATRIILLLDVLEHLQDPTALLVSCHERFSNCSHVLVTVPARQEIWSGYDRHYGHFRRYRRDTLRNEIPSDRFRVLRQGYFFHLLYPPALVMTAMGLDRSPVIRPPTRRTLIFHQLLGWYFDWEQRLVPSAIPGTSICALLRCERPGAAVR